MKGLYILGVLAPILALLVCHSYGEEGDIKDTKDLMEASSKEDSQNKHSRFLLFPPVDNTYKKPYIALYPHKSVYILPYYRSLSEPTGSNIDTETKFQFSFKLAVLNGFLSPYGVFYFAYTQSAWFQNYNKKDSRPFRDVDYQPEFFYSYEKPIAFLGGAFKDISLGYNHVSNGERSLRSRTSNRMLLNVRWEKGEKHIFGLKFRAWVFYGTHKDGFMHDNADLPSFWGYNDIQLYYKSNRHLLELYVRPPIARVYHPYFELGYTLRVSENLGLYCQYVNGYGDNMFEYNQHARRVGVGFRLWTK
ncbi:phospholipase A [Helicobacter marmotae]|uniref:Phosphatidylcholine 1-acylhydrolase n=1 Tax=Helicobacter marmotae TaxID=152490 RepID=A0A3D8I5B6_9HELI|nr:phospholipase A [Helicobacter marmotae]RDU59751.1 phospholipase [Helicobacter marmotae]